MCQWHFVGQAVRGMRVAVMTATLAGLVACASAPVPPVDAGLFADDRFAPPSQTVDASDLFEASPAMLHFVRKVVQPLSHREGPMGAVVKALNDRAKLRLEYDSDRTRTASQAFDDRAGNCLSLVVLTAAIAHEMGLAVQFQSAVDADLWTRVGDLQVASGHVNVTLGMSRPGVIGLATDVDLIVDFLPPATIAGLRVRPIDRETVVAMYMNNRAAESLMRGSLDDAYAWVRAAIRTKPGLALAFNTLGVVYQRHGDLALAERAYAHALRIEPSHRQALANQVQLLVQQQRGDDAVPLQQRLARLEPEPPFKYFDDGVAAMDRHDYAAARDLFAREVARADYQPEFRFWLGLAHWRLGEMPQALAQFERARELSTRREDRDRYALKLEALRSLAAH